MVWPDLVQRPGHGGQVFQVGFHQAKLAEEVSDVLPPAPPADEAVDPQPVFVQEVLRQVAADKADNAPTSPMA